MVHFIKNYENHFSCAGFTNILDDAVSILVVSVRTFDVSEREEAFLSNPGMGMESVFLDVGVEEFDLLLLWLQLIPCKAHPINMPKTNVHIPNV